jgi:rubredoxin
MSDGPCCPKCSSRSNYILHSTDMFSDKPSSTWRCTRCGLMFAQFYKLHGKPVLVEEGIEDDE